MPKVPLSGKGCPDCGKHGGLTLATVLAVKRLGTYSIAGAQDKAVAVQRVELACSLCGTSRIGRLEGTELRDDGDGMVTFTGGYFVQEGV